jgi:hypothetical protein
MVECCKRDETDYLTNAGQSKAKKSQRLTAPLHVDIIYVAIINGIWPRELNDWLQKPSGQVSAKERIVETITCIPNSTMSYNPGQLTP